MSEISYDAWAESALSWIDDDSLGLPWPLPTAWCLGEATEDYPISCNSPYPGDAR